MDPQQQQSGYSQQEMEIMRQMQQQYIQQQQQQMAMQHPQQQQQQQQPSQQQQYMPYQQQMAMQYMNQPQQYMNQQQQQQQQPSVNDVMAGIVYQLNELHRQQQIDYNTFANQIMTNSPELRQWAQHASSEDQHEHFQKLYREFQANWAEKIKMLEQHLAMVQQQFQQQFQQHQHQQQQQHQQQPAQPSAVVDDDLENLFDEDDDENNHNVPQRFNLRNMDEPKSLYNIVQLDYNPRGAYARLSKLRVRCGYTMHKKDMLNVTRFYLKFMTISNGLVQDYYNVAYHYERSNRPKAYVYWLKDSLRDHVLYGPEKEVEEDEEDDDDDATREQLLGRIPSQTFSSPREILSTNKQLTKVPCGTLKDNATYQAAERLEKAYALLLNIEDYQEMNRDSADKGRLNALFRELWPLLDDPVSLLKSRKGCLLVARLLPIRSNALNIIHYLQRTLMPQWRDVSSTLDTLEQSSDRAAKVVRRFKENLNFVLERVHAKESSNALLRQLWDATPVFDSNPSNRDDYSTLHYMTSIMKGTVERNNNMPFKLNEAVNMANHLVDMPNFMAKENHRHGRAFISALRKCVGKKQSAALGKALNKKSKKKKPHTKKPSSS